MKRKIGLIALIIAVFAIIGIVYYRYYYVFGEGVKAGSMNYFVKKGYLFKTYEGRLIQAGIKTPAGGTVQSNEFMFSVTDEKIAQKLNENAGAYLELHYKEYVHSLPWRGVSAFVVDSVISVRKDNPQPTY